MHTILRLHNRVYNFKFMQNGMVYSFLRSTGKIFSLSALSAFCTIRNRFCTVSDLFLCRKTASVLLRSGTEPTRTLSYPIRNWLSSMLSVYNLSCFCPNFSMKPIDTIQPDTHRTASKPIRFANCPTGF